MLYAMCSCRGSVHASSARIAFVERILEEVEACGSSRMGWPPWHAGEGGAQGACPRRGRQRWHANRLHRILGLEIFSGKTRGASMARNMGDVELQAKVTSKFLFEVEIGGKRVGKVVIGLFSEVVPKMIDNFRALCTGEKGDVYKGCFFHRIIKGFHDSGWGFCRKTMSEEH
nr:peptidyl-prolyl cis-trans isomerase CYP20-3, chloroplastic-like [Lolium perenne]